MVEGEDAVMIATLKPTVAANERARPMWTIGGLKSLLSRNEDQVLSLIENGDLLWAFDLSLVPERASRKELRVLPACVETFLAGRKCELQWDDVARLIVPHNLLSITSLEIQRSLNVTSTHVGALMRRKLLGRASEARTGPGGSARVMTSAFLDFMKSRRFC
jgi:hypothetical protein